MTLSSGKITHYNWLLYSHWLMGFPKQCSTFKTGGITFMLGNLKCIWIYFSKACLNLKKQLCVLCLKQQLVEMLLSFNPEQLVGDT